MISEYAVRKLGLPYEAHPMPYSLAWVQDGVAVRINHRSLVPFSIGPHYKERTWCDVAPMDVCHLILGRPWEFDRKIIHDGAKNTYNFIWETQQILLVPSREQPAPTPVTSIPPPPPLAQSTSSNSSSLLCSYARFEEEFQQEGVAYALISSPVRSNQQ